MMTKVVCHQRRPTRFEIMRARRARVEDYRRWVEHLEQFALKTKADVTQLLNGLKP